MTAIIYVINYIRYFLNRLNRHCISAFSGQACLFIMISFFPFVMFLLTLIRYLPVTESTLLQICTDVLPPSFSSFVVSIIEEIYSKSTDTLLSVTVITALWSASRGFLTIIKGLNYVYDIPETRNYIRVRFIAAIYTLIFAILILVTLIVLVFGNRLYHELQRINPLLGNLIKMIVDIRTLTGFFILFLFFLILFLFIPNRKSHITSEIPGAFVSSAGWIGFSYLFSIYIDHFGNYSYTYGSLTAIVLLMLWLYSCMYILFIGGEINGLFAEGGFHSENYRDFISRNIL
jgi:membrane protein